MNTFNRETQREIKRETKEELDQLRNTVKEYMVKNDVNVNRAVIDLMSIDVRFRSGFVDSQIAHIMDIKKETVTRAIDKALKQIRHPSNGRAFKEYVLMGQGQENTQF